MRVALRESSDAVAHPVDGYPAGSIIICVSCGKPLFRLDAFIAVGDRVGRSAWKYKPVRPRDLTALVDRADVHPGTRAWVKAQTWVQLIAYCDLIPSPRAGDPCLCPQCGHVWVEARSAETSDTLDRAFVYELHFIPPLNPGPPTHRPPGQSPFLR